MLKNRSFLGFETGTQTRMTTDRTSSLPSPTQSQTTSPVPSNSLGSSPRIFNGFLSRTLSAERETAAMSPTSILDTKPFSSSNLVNPLFGHDRHMFKSPNNPSSLDHNNNNSKHPFEEVDRVGLAIVDSLTSEKTDTRYLCSSPYSGQSKMVLFGAKLKVQIPPLPSTLALISPAATASSQKSPADFGIKTTNSRHLSSGFWSPMKAKHSPHQLEGEGLSLSLSEMELSEDYTCVITHGPNPKTTHIFDDCVLENCCGVIKLSDSGKDGGLSAEHSTSLCQ